jgi:hypothetical protein
VQLHNESCSTNKEITSHKIYAKTYKTLYVHYINTRLILSHYTFNYKVHINFTNSPGRYPPQRNYITYNIRKDIYKTLNLHYLNTR